MNTSIYGSTYNPQTVASPFVPMVYTPVGTQPVSPQTVAPNAQIQSVMMPATQAVGKIVTSGVPLTQTTYATQAAGSLPWQTAGSVMNPSVVASGTVPQGMAATGASMAGVTTAAVAGYWGGTKLAESLNLNPTGGGLGGAGGAALGAYYGSIVPGIGTITGAVVGGLLGSLGGGLFGNNKPSDFTQAGGINITSGGIVDRYAKEESSTGKKYNDQIAKLRDNIQTGASAYTKWLVDNGATLKDPNDNKDMLFIVGGRDGFRTAELPNGWDKSQRIPEQKLPGYTKYGKDFKAYSNGISSSIQEKYNIPEELQKRIDEKKSNGELDDITTFGQKNYTTTYAKDLIASTQVDTIIERNQGSPTKWRDFLKSYNEKYSNG